MADLPWMIYGASGATGRMIVAEALRRGHRPLLAGRDAASLSATARAAGLEAVAVGLDDPARLRDAVRHASVVVHAAGPFVATAWPMIEACLDARVPYLDISGELDTFVAQQRYDERAKRAGVPLVSGCGFGVVAGDCAALHVSRRLPGATSLRLGIAPQNRGGRSAGVALSTLSVVAGGGAVIAGGTLRRGPLAERTWSVDRPELRAHFASAPLAELVAAWRSTGIPDVVAGAPMPAVAALGARAFGPLVMRALRLPWLRRALERRLARSSEKARAAMSAPKVELGRMQSVVWAEAARADGQRAASLLLLPEGYAFAARATTLAAERIGTIAAAGALTPAQAFGPDFALEIEGARRVDIEEVP